MVENILLGMILILFGFVIGFLLALNVDKSTTETTKVYYTDYDKIIDKIRVDMYYNARFPQPDECAVQDSLNELRSKLIIADYKLRELREMLND